MKTPPINPANWRLQTLLSLGNEQVHELACRAVGTLTTYRLILGRCLLALHENKGFKKFGCSSAIHYACSVLGISARQARVCRRVARLLIELPELSLAAENGAIAWSKLREIVRKASPETELFWLRLAGEMNYKEIEVLVRRTPRGSIPGAVDPHGESYSSEMRCALKPEVFQMLEQARRFYSLERDEAVTNAEVLEWALAAYLSQQPLDEKVLKKVREEADKDLMAERARRLPVVVEAREVAEEMGLLDRDRDKDGSGAATCSCDCGTEEMTRTEQMAELTDFIGAVSEEVQAEMTRAWQNPNNRYNPANRFATKSQKQEILRRDNWCCRVPGCPNRVWLHLHHIKPYSQGGPTTRENLLSLCTGCHQNHHRGLLKIDFKNGELVFRDQDGRRLDQQANLQLAGWLDRWQGWSGGEFDSHTARAYGGEWAVF